MSAPSSLFYRIDDLGIEDAINDLDKIDSTLSFSEGNLRDLRILSRKFVILVYDFSIKIYMKNTLRLGFLGDWFVKYLYNS
jgi:hypothetical protein